MPFYLNTTDKDITYNDTGTGAAFASEAELAEVVVAQNLSKEDVTAVWNTFAGVVPFDDLRPQKKFKNKPYGVKAIWKAIQRLVPPDTDSATVSTEPIDSEPPIEDPEKMNKLNKRDGRRAKKKGLAAKVKDAVEKPVRAKKAPKVAKPNKVERKDRGRRDGTKRARFIELLQRKNGASGKELQEEFGWQPHSVRGFVSTLNFKGGVKIEAEKHASRDMVYRIAS